MVKQRLPEHERLLSDVWVVTGRRQDLDALTEYVTQLQSNAIALAAAYGVKQAEIAEIAGVSRQRISQIVDDVDVTGLDREEIHSQTHELEEWPADVMRRLNAPRHQAERGDPTAIAAQRRKVVIVYGESEAASRDLHQPHKAADGRGDDVSTNLRGWNHDRP